MVELKDTRDLKSLEGDFVPVQVGPGYQTTMKTAKVTLLDDNQVIEFFKSFFENHKTYNLILAWEYDRKFSKKLSIS